jgi:acylpyruvate hydrolase
MNFWCVGRNYAEHAKELGNPLPLAPVIFLKSGSCLVRGDKIFLPQNSDEYHYELEIAFRFDANKNFDCVALALDLTNRTWQDQLKKQGQPWTLAKSFIGACPLSQDIQLTNFGQLKLQLELNQQIRQQGDATQMIFSPEFLRSYILKYLPVEPGDYLLTGTPAGVGALNKGDRLRGILMQNQQILLEAQWTVER